MAIADHRHHHHNHLHKSNSDVKLFRLCPFWQSSNTSSSSSSTQNLTHSSIGNLSNRHVEVSSNPKPSPPKTVKSAVRLKNTSRSHVAFKFQTTAPKSCYMRPPGGILAPGESIIATVFKFVEHGENSEKQLDQRSKIKFKIMSLKVKGGIEYVPELFDEQKDEVTVERILRVVFLDVERPSPALEKLKRQLAEAEAALETRKKPPVDTGPRVVGEGLVIDEWKERREKYLARQQVEVTESA
uniref:MSP domain-containing protein n=1 Tax=Fagus sylvatica TaxID=28930 RepID=A0A2N9EYX0_FAGSY